MGSLNLIHFLDFWFALMFFAGLWRRFGQYQNAARLALSMPGRWPNLLKLVSQYRTVFWTWSMLMPALLALFLWLAQMMMSRLVLPAAGSPQDGLSIARLFEEWPALFVVGPLGLAMFLFDLYSLYVVGRIDRPMLEKHFDQAEYWLQSRTADVIRIATFGRFDPRKIVASEVETALIAVGDSLNFTLWWVIIQTGLRFAFALSLWLTWAITH
ncbi:MAG TPA: hypothetical protein VFE62_10460 [Gemmataceae bacterium]|nr:hypothetical protein [Gemmataceae bacterium]